MSCEKQPGKVSATAAVKAGIGGLQSRFSATTGRITSALTGRVGQSATSVLVVVESFDGPKSLDALGVVPLALEAGALLAAAPPKRRWTVDEWGNPYTKQQETTPAWFKEGMMDRREGWAKTAWQNPYTKQQEIMPAWFKDRRPAPEPMADRAAERLRRRAILAFGLLKLGQAVSVFAGTGLSRLSRKEQVGVVGGIEQRFFFLNTTRLPVRVWKSRLTPLLNRADAEASRLLRSDGIMFEVGGKSWHRGTTVVKTAQGERTLTHLQSFSLPATHYYFDRRLADNEAIGIVSGQKGFEPKYLPGYAGQVSEVESLFPAYAGLKHQLIKAHLRWGKQGRGAEEQRGGKAGEQEGDRVGLHPLDGVKAQVNLGGQDYPVMVRRVVTRPDQRRLADAAYYDDQAGAWKEVTDLAVREQLARRVEAGLLETIETREVSN